MRKIGPTLTVTDDFVPNMQEAYEVDSEHGSHQINNIMSAKLNREWPTVVAMAELIEKQRDQLLKENKKLKKYIKQIQ